MSDTTVSPIEGMDVPQTDASGRLVIDAPCRRCGYNLRGALLSGRCSECGTAVGLSVHGDLLRYADPSWLAKIELGLRITLWMIVLWIFLGAAIGFITVTVHPAFGALLGLFASIMSFYGAWLITEPDPSRIGEDSNITARRVVRFALLVGLASQFVQILGGQLALPRELVVFLGILALVAGIVWMVGEFAKFIYYEKLADRIPEIKLAKRARFLRWGYVVSLGIIIVGTMAGALLESMAATGPAPTPSGAGPVQQVSFVESLTAIIGCLMMPAFIATFVFFLLTIRLLFRLRRAIAQQRDLARQIWQAEAV